MKWNEFRGANKELLYYMNENHLRGSFLPSNERVVYMGIVFFVEGWKPVDKFNILLLIINPANKGQFKIVPLNKVEVL